MNTPSPPEQEQRSLNRRAAIEFIVAMAVLVSLLAWALAAAWPPGRCPATICPYP